MSLILRVSITGDYSEKLIAIAALHNTSDLADVSNYIGTLEEFGNIQLGIPKSKKSIKITDYERKQSVWNLISKMVDGKHYG